MGTEYIKSDTIVATIRDILLRTQISLDNFRGQCYDGASNMLRKKSGVAKQIQDIQPKAFVTHCHCHSLSLSVKETTKESKFLSDAMDVGAEIAIFFLAKFSPKRESKSWKSSNYRPEILRPLTVSVYFRLQDGLFVRTVSSAYLITMAICISYGKSASKNLVSTERNIGCKSQMEYFDLYFSFRFGKLLYSHTD